MPTDPDKIDISVDFDDGRFSVKGGMMTVTMDAQPVDPGKCWFALKILHPLLWKMIHSDLEEMQRWAAEVERHRRASGPVSRGEIEAMVEAAQAGAGNAA